MIVKFDTRQDNELIATGTHFWCHACMVARPLDDVSPDPRYCQRCYESLAADGYFQRVKTHPRTAPGAAAPARNASAATVTPLHQGKDTSGDNVTARIIGLAAAGNSTREISTILQGDGINISHMTIARRIKNAAAQQGGKGDGCRGAFGCGIQPLPGTIPGEEQ